MSLHTTPRLFRRLAAPAAFLAAVLAVPAVATATAAAGTTAPIVGAAIAPKGYWLAYPGSVVGRDGAPSYHFANRQSPLVGVTRAGLGLWAADRTGQVFNAGRARFYGSAVSRHLHLPAPVAGVTANAWANGYWLWTARGNVFNFGGARFHGSPAHSRLPAPVVGLAAAPNGYWLALRNGTVLSYGAARRLPPVHATIAGIQAAPGGGYWLWTPSGQVIARGAARNFGSPGVQATAAFAGNLDGRGYLLAAAGGTTAGFGADTAYTSGAGSSPTTTPPTTTPPTTAPPTTTAPAGGAYVTYVNDQVSASQACVNLGNGQVILNYDIVVKTSPGITNLGNGGDLTSPDAAGRWQSEGDSGTTNSSGVTQFTYGIVPQMSFTFPAGQSSYTVSPASYPLTLIVGGRSFTIDYKAITIPGSACS